MLNDKKVCDWQHTSRIPIQICKGAPDSPLSRRTHRSVFWLLRQEKPRRPPGQCGGDGCTWRHTVWFVFDTCTLTEFCSFIDSFLFQKFKFILHFIPKNGTPGVAPPRHNLSHSNGFFSICWLPTKMKAKRCSDLVTSRFKKSAAANMMQDQGTLIIPWKNSSLWFQNRATSFKQVQQQRHGGEQHGQNAVLKVKPPRDRKSSELSELRTYCNLIETPGMTAAWVDTSVVSMRSSLSEKLPLKKLQLWFCETPYARLTWR